MLIKLKREPYPVFMKLVLAQSNLTLKGGAERVVLKIAQHYKAKIYVAEYDREKTFEEFGNLDIETIGKKGASRFLPYGRASQGLNYGLSFYNFRIDDDYDVINAHIAPSHWIRKHNERVLWYCHTPLRDIYDLYHYRLSLKKFHEKPIHMIGARAVKSIDQGVVRDIEYILTNSYNTRSRVVKFYGRKDAAVLGGGIDYKDYKNEGDNKYFVYPSRISPNKRQEYAIRAFNHFKRQVKGYKLIIAGAVSHDKFYYNYYKKIIALSEAIGDIYVVPNPSEEMLKKLYSNSTAVLYAPVDEDYGLVPLEAMASHKPVIAVNEGGPKETIEDGKTGILVNSETEMGNAMKSIAENPSFAKELGRRGRERIERYYSWPLFFNKFDKVLRKVKKR
jgi:glycosyltransferase involved in cell wall biosynthesis